MMIQRLAANISLKALSSMLVKVTSEADTYFLR